MPLSAMVRAMEVPPSGVRVTVSASPPGRVWRMSIRVVAAAEIGVPGATVVVPSAAVRVTSGVRVNVAGVVMSVHWPVSRLRVPEEGMPERVMEDMVHGGSASPAENVTEARAWVNVRAQGDWVALIGLARSRSGYSEESAGTVKEIVGLPWAEQSGRAVMPLAA